jgi:outer membrane lipoprotein-sorting protein
MAIAKTASCLLAASALVALAAAQSSSSIAVYSLGTFSHKRSSTHFGDAKAWRLLQRTMEQDRFTPCSGVIFQRDAESKSMMELFAEQSSDGRLKLTVLSPLSQQGVTCIDDGNQWLTYHPDENKVYLQPSPRTLPGSPKARIKIAQKNYDIKLESADSMVAGRRVYTLLARSRFPEMPARRYSIDQSKPFLLRMEVLSKGEAKVILDTKNVDFPPNVPEDHFELQPRDRTRLTTFNGPENLPMGSNARELVGFEPAIPAALPFGFNVMQPQVSGSKKCRFVAVRITDGLVNATVYEWDKKNGKCTTFRNRKHDREAKGIGMRVVGEVPEVVLVKLLDSFIKDALKGAEPMLALNETTETPEQPNTLNWKQRNSEEESEHSDTESAPQSDFIIAWIEIDQ